MLTKIKIAAVIATFLATGAVFTGSADAWRDAERGKTSAYTCLGCNAIEGDRNAYPSYCVPKLGGRHEEYLIKSIKHYRDGSRNEAVMAQMVAPLSDADVIVLARSYSRLEGLETTLPE